MVSDAASNSTSIRIYADLVDRPHNGGFVVFYKRLEAGRFRRPITAEGDVSVKLDSTQLAMLLDGIDMRHGCKRPWYELP
jgi:hypothetical protein